MMKKQKAQLLAKLIEDVKRENRNVYLAETNRERMAAAQRGMYAFGMVIGLTGGYPLDYRVESLQTELFNEFGCWSFQPGCWFSSFNDKDCEKLAAEHRRQYEKE